MLLCDESGKFEIVWLSQESNKQDTMKRKKKNTRTKTNKQTKHKKPQVLFFLCSAEFS